MDDETEPGGLTADAELVAAVRAFLDRFAPAAPDAATARALAADLRAWTRRLEPLAVAEDDPFLAARRDLPGGGRVLVPPLTVTYADDDEIRGKVVFGRAFLGGHGAAHGGMLPLLFDDVLGRIANSGDRARARTAYIHVDYRSVTWLNVALDVTARLVRIEGRKRLLRGELRHGDVLCAEAEGLFVELKPGQP